LGQQGEPRILANAASTYFSARARQSWRILGYGAIAFPFLLTLHASPLVVGLAELTFVIPSIWNFVASQRERNGDKMPTSVAFEGGRIERREFGSLTFRALLNQWKAELPLEGFITEAAKCSNDYGRRLSVIYVRIPNLPRAMRELVANLLRMNLRSTDEVAIISSDEFVVCAPLLRDAVAAEVISKRLAEAIRKADLASAAPEVHFGKAIYPMDGYTGADLIRHSRSVARLAA
jgi:hypothetical protein